MFQINNCKDFYIYKNRYQGTLNYDINKQDYVGNTILHKAIISGNCDLTKEILSQKETDITIKNIEGLAPIFYINKLNKKLIEEMLNIFINIVGPSIFTIFNSKGLNILNDKNIQLAVTHLQNL